MTPELSRTLFHYNKSTGQLVWAVNARGRSAKGSPAGTIDSDGYIVVRYKGVGYKAHRIVWLMHFGSWPSAMLDHINGHKSDNRIDNLRLGGESLNNLNIAAPNRNTRSGYRGVSWFAQYGKWKAMIQYKGVSHFIGHFDCPKQAHVAYLDARKRLTGVTTLRRVAL